MKRKSRLTDLQKKARAEAGRQLATALEAWTEPPSKAVLRTADQLLARPPYMLTVEDVCVLKHALTRRQFNTIARAARVCAHEEQLLAWMTEDDAALTGEELCEKARLLTVYLANVFIPCAARLARFDLAVNAVRRFLTRLSNIHHEYVGGAGAATDGQELRYLLLGPCLCSLAYHFPADRP